MRITTTRHIIKAAALHLSAGLLGFMLGHAAADTPHLLHSVLLLLDLLSGALSALDEASLNTIQSMTICLEYVLCHHLVSR